MDDVVALLLFPFAAAVLFCGIHTWFGLQILRRKVIFADLALAQLSALGAIVAVAIGHAPASPAGFAYALTFALLGAGLLTALRRLSAHVNQEAIIGVVYIASTALTVLVIDRSPQGAEHVKKMLVGNILTIDRDDVVFLLLLYGAIGVIHFLLRGPLLAAAAGDHSGKRLMLWDFLFYASFGIVVTSSVSRVGVLLVFSFLIVPAVIGNLYSRSVLIALCIGWAAGIAASAAGFGLSLAFDMPTGAILVVSFASVLAIAALVQWFRTCGWTAFRLAGRGVAGVLSIILLGQGLWLLVAPHADQPVMALLEATNTVAPDHFLTERERQTLRDAAASEVRLRDQVEKIYEAERSARWQGEGLSEEQVQHLSSFQRSYNEMGRGERFVQEVLRSRGRSQGRWFVAIPLLVGGGVGLALVSGIAARIRTSRTRSFFAAVTPGREV